MVKQNLLQWKICLNCLMSIFVAIKWHWKGFFTKTKLCLLMCIKFLVKIKKKKRSDLLNTIFIGTPPVLCHGDFWSNNVFFDVDDDGKINDHIAALFDFQFAHPSNYKNYYTK